jgi:hypothetical protein
MTLRALESVLDEVIDNALARYAQVLTPGQLRGARAGRTRPRCSRGS